MSLAQAWGRKLLGASGVALVVPAAIVDAVAALVLAGGFGRLGTLGQAFSGLPIPALEQAGGAGAGAGVAAGVGGGASGGPGSAGGGGSSSGGGSSGRRGFSGRRGSSGGSGSGGSSGGGGSAGSGGSGGTGGGGSLPGHPPTLTDTVVAAGAAVTTQVPAPVGSVATQTLQSVVRTVNRILPLPPVPGLGGSASGGG
jgi:hypothetical protein